MGNARIKTKGPDIVALGRTDRPAVTWDKDGDDTIHGAEHLCRSTVTRRRGRIVAAHVTVEVSPGHGETVWFDLADRAMDSKGRPQPDDG